MTRLALVLPALLLGTSLPAMAQDARSIVAQWNAQFSEAFNARSAQSLSTLFTNDAFVIPPIAPSGRGPDFVVKFYTEVLKGNWSGHKQEVIEASQVADDTIVAASHWSANLADTSGKVTTYYGDVAEVFTKVGNQWKGKLGSWSLLSGN